MQNKNLVEEGIGEMKKLEKRVYNRAELEEIF